MKRKSTIITVSALTILALMITVLVIKDGDSGFALKILYYVIPFFSLAFGVYGMLRGLAKNHIWFTIFHIERPVKTIPFCRS